jgi:hypothetical protein
MEYWTGVELSDNFTQVYQKSYHIHIYNDMINNTIYFLTLQADIKHFRPKLVAILLSSDLNKRKGCPLSLLLIKAVRVACRSAFVQSGSSIAVVQSGSSITTLTS